MSDRNTPQQEQATDGLSDIMQDVASQLSNDLYEIPQKAPLDKELQSIGDKLADTAPDINLDDDIINLLESDGEFGLPKDGGLSYEEPSTHVGADADTGNDFAATLAAEAWNLETSPTQTSAQANSGTNPQAKPVSGQLDDDPMLLLEDELAMGKKSSGGLMGAVALVFALLATGGAGYAVWQGMATKGQTQAVAEQLESRTQETNTQPDPAYEQRLTKLEQRLESGLGSLDGRIDQQAAMLEGQQTQLGQALDAIRQQNTAEPLGGIQAQLASLNQTLTGLDQRLTQGQQALEHQQQQLGSELEQRFQTLTQGLNKTPDSSAVIIAEPAAAAPSAQTPLKAEQTHQPPKAPITKPRVSLVVKPKVDKPAKPEKQKSTATPAVAQPDQPGGPWVVNLVSTVSEKEARALSVKLQRHGIFPKVKMVSVKGTTWYRLHVDGFANAAAAKRYADSVKGKPGLGQAWAGKAD